MELPAHLLTKLTDVLREPAHARAFPVKLWARLVAQGWVSSAELEDLLLAMDSRLSRLPVDDLAEHLGFSSRAVVHKPRFASSEVTLFFMLSTTDVTGFVVTLEQLGFAVSPGPMVDTFIEHVRAAPILTLAELDILTYVTQRAHRRLYLEANSLADAETAGERSWSNHNGYRFRASIRGEQVAALTVTGPKYRKPRRIEKTCDICKYSFTQGDPESALSHRRVHAEVVRLVQPRSTKGMRERLAKGRAFAERVDVNAPMWLHREVYERALRFKRDFGYDWLQWHEARRREDIDPKWRGFVFVDDAGAIDGACSFAREQDGWTLCWVWIRPARRRHGLLAERWPSFLDEFGDFWIEHPLSSAMTSFVAHHGSPRQRQRIAERYPEGHEIALPRARAV